MTRRQEPSEPSGMATLIVVQRSHSPLQNQLLASLPGAVLGRFEPSLELVSMSLGEVLYESGTQLSHVYFPTTVDHHVVVRHGGRLVG